MSNLGAWSAPFLVKRHDGHKEKAEGYFKRNNQIVKNAFWIIVIASVCLLGARRLARWFDQRKATKRYQRGTYHAVDNPKSTSIQPSKNTRFAATFRRVTYSSSSYTGRWSRYLSPPSRGEGILLALYFAMLMIMMWTNVIFESPVEVLGIRWEVVGFRAAWVSTIQFPLLYCTGCRINPISLITGVTHERLNWFHRWVARMIFLTLIVHWAFFFREWVLANSVQQVLQTMTMVLWGFGAWAAIGLMVITGYGVFRVWSYEVWLASHISLAYGVLYLSYTHTHCTTYYVAASLGFMIFDVCGRAVLFLVRNVRLTRQSNGAFKNIGQSMQLEILDHQYLRVQIPTTLAWKPGQHVYISVPQLRKFESHPFTIANVSPAESSKSNIELIVKAHTGFTRSLYQAALNDNHSDMLALVQGPYGNPPQLSHYDTVVFIATGNRASFTIPLLQKLCMKPGRVTKIVLWYIVPDEEMLKWYGEQLSTSFDLAKQHGIDLEINVYSTSTQRQCKTVSDVEKWADDTFSIGKDSIDSSRSSVEMASQQFLVEDTESALLSGSSHAKSQDLAPIPPKQKTNSNAVSAEIENDEDEKHGLLSHTDRDESGNDIALTQMNAASSWGTRHSQINSGRERSSVSSSHHSDALSATELATTAAMESIQISYGRPSANVMITRSVVATRLRAHVMVVADTAPLLRSQVANCVAKINGEIGRTQNGSSRQEGSVSRISSLELWSETNGE